MQPSGGSDLAQDSAAMSSSSRRPGGIPKPRGKAVVIGCGLIFVLVFATYEYQAEHMVEPRRKLDPGLKAPLVFKSFNL